MKKYGLLNWMGDYLAFVTLCLIPAIVCHKLVPDVSAETYYIEFGLGYIYCKVCEVLFKKGA